MANFLIITKTRGKKIIIYNYLKRKYKSYKYINK